MIPTERYKYLLKQCLEAKDTPEEYAEFLKLTASDEFDAVFEEEFEAHLLHELNKSFLAPTLSLAEDKQIQDKMSQRLLAAINPS
jgi:hypothetical protein